MKPPPYLLGAALLFWGWQAGLPIIGAVMAVVLESPRWLKARWEFTDEDFNRIWTFCALLLLAAAVLAFTANDVPSSFGSYFQNPNVTASRIAGVATSRATAAWIRWLPMLFFLFMAAQSFSLREGVPLETISLILRIRWRRARKSGAPMPPQRTINVSYPYLVLCLLAASAHGGDSPAFFVGLCVLVAWALSTQRSRRQGWLVWGAALGVALVLGYFGQRGIGQLQRYLEDFNPQWFSRFSRPSTDPGRSRTGLGHIGRLKLSGTIIIRLETKAGLPPLYLREASYRSFNPRLQVWSSETSTNDFQPVAAGSDTTSYVLAPGKATNGVVNIACYLDGGQGLLPLPSGTRRLEHLFVNDVQQSPLGAVLAQGPGLAIFDALHGPGPTLDSPANTKGDLPIPPGETNAIREVMSELAVDGQTDDAQKLRTLQAFFLNRFSYSMWEKPEPQAGTNDSPLTRFLLKTRKGHCEYFATAGVLLLREMGLPARYAVGYSVHEGAGSKYVVRQRDAHAWCLVWNKKTRAWEDFDPTPPSWVEEEAKRASPFEFLNDLWSRLSFEFSKLRWGQTRVRQYVLWALVPVLAVLLYQIVFRSKRRHRRLEPPTAGSTAAWPGLDSEFYELAAGLGQRGMARQSGESWSEWQRRVVAEPALARLAATLDRSLKLHYRYRFDPEGLTAQERQSLRQEARACLDQLT
jgi:protein-glutamine gamma-glutamyltransferase